MTKKINYEQITVNLGGKVRLETLDGVEYIIAPMTVLQEGVFAGSSGPVLYTKEELGRNPAGWNGKTVIINHPYVDGKPVSADDPRVSDTVKVGVIQNSELKDSKLRQEAKMPKQKLLDNHKQVHDDIMAEKIIEVSTGLFREEDETAGDFNGATYNSIAKGIEPDHLAILTNSQGACSIACGCGLLQFNEKHPIANQKSWMDIIRELRNQIDSRFGYSSNIMDVFDSWFVYSFSGSLWKLGYKASDLGVTISDETPLQVYYVTQYKLADGTVVGNSSGTFNEREINMDRKTQVDKLITANCGWKEGQREFLMKLPEENFIPIAATLNTAPPPVPAPAPAPVITPPTVPAKIATAQEYINNAPPEIKMMLQNGLEAQKAEVNYLVDVITKNPLNKFPKEYLENKANQDNGLMELRGLAALAAPAITDNGQANGSQMPYLPPIYPGMAGGPAPVINAHTEEALEFGVPEKAA